MARNMFLKLEAVIIRTDRNAAIQSAGDAVLQAGGWITNHFIYSDTRAVLNFQIPADKTGELGRRLLEKGVKAGPEEIPETMGSQSSEVFGQLGLTFPEGKGDMKHEVPPFG